VAFPFLADEKYLAFTKTEASGISLWVVDMSTYQAKKLTDPIVNQVFGNSVAWLPDNSILIKAVNPARGSMPKRQPHLPAL
jgi:Tol biopolymer transport system component